jgi:hypothetical protein
MTEISSEQGLIRLNHQDLADVEALLRLCDLPFEALCPSSAQAMRLDLSVNR